MDSVTRGYLHANQKKNVCLKVKMKKVQISSKTYGNVLLMDS